MSKRTWIPLVSMVFITICAVEICRIVASDGYESGHRAQKLIVTISSEDDELEVLYQFDEKKDWGEYRILVSSSDDLFDRTELFAEGDLKTGYGDVLIFKDTKGEWDPETGIEYIVKVVLRETNTVIWEDDIIA